VFMTGCSLAVVIWRLQIWVFWRLAGWLAGAAWHGCWAWTVAMAQARLAFAGDARKCRLVAEADRRPARVRSSRTAVVALVRAAAIAMRVICQPGMPPAVISWAVPPGVAGPQAVPGHGTGMVAAEAAGTAAQASTPPVTAARAAMKRRNRVLGTCRFAPSRSRRDRGTITGNRSPPTGAGGYPPVPLEATMEEHFVWMTTRRIKPGTLAEFERAWRPGMHPDGMVRAYAYWSDDEQQIIGVSFWDSKESCDAWRASEAEARRRSAMDPHTLDEQEAFYRGRELIVPAR
jgi:heme-degrading monooxygenase HmoA